MNFTINLITQELSRELQDNLIISYTILTVTIMKTFNFEFIYFQGYCFVCGLCKNVWVFCSVEKTCAICSDHSKQTCSFSNNQGKNEN